MIEVRIGKLAEKFSVHRNTVSNWIKSGKLVAQLTIAKRYLIEETELLRFCDQFGISKDIIHEFEKRDNRFVPPVSIKRDSLESKSPMSGKIKIRNRGATTDKPIGSVMVVGGGIAGMQATLDLAESGYSVYMVEKSAGIGGAIVQLDKAFPTNDCAM